MKKLVKWLQAQAFLMHLSLSEDTCIQCISFLTLLQKWNRAYNLTAITDINKMISYHVLDSLSLVPYLKGNRIIDIGSGAGLPGIPLAIYCPEKHFVLLDSIGKKTRFLNQVVRQLSLSNVEVVQARAEKYQTHTHFDTIMARALGSIDYLMAISQHLLYEQGRLLVMKSDSKAEILPHGARSITLSVPGITSPRSLIMIEKQGGSLDKNHCGC